MPTHLDQYLLPIIHGTATWQSTQPRWQARVESLLKHQGVENPSRKNARTVGTRARPRRRGWQMRPARSFINGHPDRFQFENCVVYS